MVRIWGTLHGDRLYYVYREKLNGSHWYDRNTADCEVDDYITSLWYLVYGLYVVSHILNHRLIMSFPQTD
jgi:hypothetical protein